MMLTVLTTGEMLAAFCRNEKICRLICIGSDYSKRSNDIRVCPFGFVMINYL
jgi:hypothetical protein